MRAQWWTLVRRELGGFFCSLSGYVIIAAAAFLMGLSFVVLMVKLQQEPTTMPVTELFYVTPFFWLIVLLAAPVITMRLFAAERANGTFETLMTTPVGDLTVVLAKFTGALAFYLVMWLPLLGCLALVRYYTQAPGAMDPGLLASTYLGISLVGALFISLGCFASAITKSQTVAAMVGLVMGAGLFMLGFLADNFGNPQTWHGQLLGSLGLFDQMHDFARGVIDTRPIVLYVSLTWFFLFLTLRAVESRRWK